MDSNTDRMIRKFPARQWKRRML